METPYQGGMDEVAKYISYVLRTVACVFFFIYYCS